MQYTILLSKNENTKEVEAQEQARFVKSVLETLEVPVDLKSEEPLSVDDKIKFRKALNNYNINIINDSDGGLKIFVNKDLIGEWFKCKYILKKDYNQIDPSKKLYLEMQVNFWTIFENTQ